jgi:hypothetical protein
MYLARWMGPASGQRELARPSRLVQAAVRCRRWGGDAGGAGRGGMAVNNPSGPRASRQPPHGRPGDEPGTAGPGWPGRWATIQPVPEMVALGPGQGPVTIREDTAAVADREALRWAGVMTRLADVQGLAGAPPSLGGSTAIAIPQPLGQPYSSARVEGRRSQIAAGLGLVSGSTADRTRVRARHRPAADTPPGPRARGPARPASPPTAPGWPSRLSRSTITVSWGGRRRSGELAALQGPPGQLEPGHQPGAGRRYGGRGRWGAGQGA